MRAQRLEQLRTAISELEGGWRRPDTARDTGRGVRAAHGSGRVEDLLAWLDRPGLHEWLGGDQAAGLWVPPLSILLELVWRQLGHHPESRRHVVWIGKCCRPYLRALSPDREHRLLAQSIFVTPQDDRSRLWAIDLAVRCPAVIMVVADGRGLDMPSTRRLQLAAESGSARLLCARPPREQSCLSAAATRWLVRPDPGRDAPAGNPRWTVQLLRCKGVQPESRILRGPGGKVLHQDRGRRWVMEWKRAGSGVDLSAALVDRSSAASEPHVPEPQVRRTA